MTQRIMWVVWPSFLVAAAATGVFFSLFDPQEFWLFGEHLEISRMGAYTVGFFGFWGVGIGSSALTVFLSRSPWEINRCPLDAPMRPEGCPKQGACQ
jgi:hypothetical protein